jgi:alkanesulfonate monooxygenase SsuD/methylene tetrahydromethanopterin reductase-like flavin-dependent oxidoreductase (luciferase family)
VRIGIHFPNFTLPGEPDSVPAILVGTAKAAEDGGCDWFTVMDHWFQLESFATSYDPMLECYSTLAFVAAQTERIRLGALVTGVTYRYPGLHAKTATTLDVLSGGRGMLGVGAGWYEREHRGLGVPFPSLGERFERLEETLQICLQMRPPIVIGGTGERKTLKLVARYADACNLFGTGLDVVEHELEVLQRHCEAEGRDYAEITKTILGGGDAFGDPDTFLSNMERYAKLGIDHVQVMPMGPDPVGDVSKLGERVIPRLAEIGG